MRINDLQNKLFITVQIPIEIPALVPHQMHRHTWEKRTHLRVNFILYLTTVSKKMESPREFVSCEHSHKCFYSLFFSKGSIKECFIINSLRSWYNCSPFSESITMNNESEIFLNFNSYCIEDFQVLRIVFLNVCSSCLTFENTITSYHCGGRPRPTAFCVVYVLFGYEWANRKNKKLRTWRNSKEFFQVRRKL